MDQPPEGKHWIHEIKHDGYRCQVLVERGEARVFTRNGYDWTERYPSAILDGEAVVQDHNGASDFEALGSALRQRPHSIILYAFDLLHLDGKELRQKTLVERRASLKGLLGTDEQSRIQFSDEFDGDGAALFQACADRALEGIVSKHALSPYRSGRSRTWLKTKCFTESTFVVIGTDRDRKTGALRALLAHNDGTGLNYAGAALIALAIFWDVVIFGPAFAFADFSGIGCWAYETTGARHRATDSGTMYLFTAHLLVDRSKEQRS